jgi:TonB family protein
MRRALVVSLLSSFLLTAAAAGNTYAQASPSIQPRPVSTGVTNPQLVYSSSIDLPAEEIPDSFPNPARVVLKVNLDNTGSAKSIEVVQPLTQSIDQRVVEAVRQFRWSPAVLDNQTIPASVNLIVKVQR